MRASLAVRLIFELLEASVPCRAHVRCACASRACEVCGPIRSKQVQERSEKKPVLAPQRTSGHTGCTQDPPPLARAQRSQLSVSRFTICISISHHSPAIDASIALSRSIPRLYSPLAVSPLRQHTQTNHAGRKPAATRQPTALFMHAYTCQSRGTRQEIEPQFAHDQGHMQDETPV